MKKVAIAAIGLGVGVVGMAAATPAGASAARNHAGQAALHSTVAKSTSYAPDFTFSPIGKPSAGYVSGTCRYSTDGVTDGTFLSKVNGCGGAVRFNVSMEAVSVPNTWATWGSPPKTETATPHALWSNGATSMTIHLKVSTKEFGFELEPDAFQVDDVTVQFLHGASVVGTVERSPNGSAGALLFAAKVKNTSITGVNIIDNSGDDFAIANIRRKQ